MRSLKSGDADDAFSSANTLETGLEKSGKSDASETVRGRGTSTPLMQERSKQETVRIIKRYKCKKLKCYTIPSS